MAYQEVKYDFPDPDKEDDDAIDIAPSSEKEVFPKDDAKEPEIEDGVEIVDDEVDDEPKAKVKPEIEVIDDRPEEDRGHQRSKKPSEVTDEELANYSKDVQGRIKHLSKSYHDERRDREQAQRERTEMELFARRLVEENKRLKQGSTKSNAALLEQAKRTVAAEITSARREYAEAMDAGNTEAILAAEEKLAEARYKKQRVDAIRLPQETDRQQETSLQQPVGEVQQPRETQQESSRDAKAEEWRARNPWFDRNRAMQGFALGYHQELVESGVDPRSDEYYGKLDARMRQVFPSEFEDGEAEQESRKSTQNVVAGVKRTSAQPKYQVSRSGRAIAKRLGVPLEEYAKHMALLRSEK